MELSTLQIIGYIASGIIALSMTMNSIVKFRWINLVGAITFATYGFFIDAIPVFFLNGFIASVDIFYLVRIYSKKELFETLEIRNDNKYLLRFLEYHKKEIHQFFPDFKYNPEMNTVSFFVLRNMAVAGIFLAHREGEDILKVGLDYVIPQYRDYKNGKYIYKRLAPIFIQQGFKEVIIPQFSPKYGKYIERIGFKKNKEGLYAKELI